MGWTHLLPEQPHAYRGGFIILSFRGPQPGPKASNCWKSEGLAPSALELSPHERSAPEESFEIATRRFPLSRQGLYCIHCRVFAWGYQRSLRLPQWLCLKLSARTWFFTLGFGTRQGPEIRFSGNKPPTRTKAEKGFGALLLVLGRQAVLHQLLTCLGLIEQGLLGSL